MVLIGQIVNRTGTSKRIREKNYPFGRLSLAIDNRYQYSNKQQNKACCGRRAEFFFIFTLLSWSRKPVAEPPRNWLSLFLML
jgi:hypothetical protein